MNKLEYSYVYLILENNKFMRVSNSVIKTTSPSCIQYILITDTMSYSSNEFYCTALNLLRVLPIDLSQLQNSINNFEFNFRFNSRRSFEIFTFPSFFFTDDSEDDLSKFNEYINLYKIISNLNVFIIDSSLKNHQQISQFLEISEHSYFTILPSSEDYKNQYNTNNYFQSEHDFIDLINRDSAKINQSIIDYYKKQGENIDLGIDFPINPNGTFINSNDFPGSNIAQNNYFILNQIIGNIWVNQLKKPDNLITNHAERTQEIINQSQKIDNISMIMYNDVKVKPTDPFQPLLSTIVIVAPYHFPRTEKIYGAISNKKEKTWLSISRAEQNLNYEHQFNPDDISKVSHEEFHFIMNNASLRLKYLDCVAFLHARFDFSPVIRLPQIGASINMELSHLEKISSKKSSTISNIKKFGNKLRNLIIAEPLVEYLQQRNGQIFAISDLPFEWLFLDEYPLCFTHDVCRLPEFNLNGIVNSAVHASRFLYEIPTDLINKTLVIHCSSKNDNMMNNMFDLIDNFKSSLAFQSARCSSIEEIKKAIDECKPDLLIFDCHGGSSKNDLSSFLVINGEEKLFLTGDDIVKHELTAPLVILSACETMPNYGYVKLISDAFMEVGAYSVTTTFLPIKIIDAASLIIRILNNLGQIKTNSYHNNWLNFMSHMLRTTFIYETINKSRKFLKEEITNDEIAIIITKSMKFENRILALKDLDKLISRKSNSQQLKFTDLDNEWLSYSIIGRADLLYFSSWLKNYRELNLDMDKIDSKFI